MRLAQELEEWVAWKEPKSGQVESDAWDALTLLERESGAEVLLEAHVGAMARIDSSELVERVREARIPNDDRDRLISRLEESNAVFQIAVSGSTEVGAFAARLAASIETARPGVLALDQCELHLDGRFVVRV